MIMKKALYSLSYLPRLQIEYFKNKLLSVQIKENMLLESIIWECNTLIQIFDNM